MKKLILILFLLSTLVLAGCTSNENTYTPSQNAPVVNQPENNQQEIKVNEPTQVTQVKEFTIEADDLGLYPSTLTVNKGDIVKITFKVRNEKVYYGGLDFRSNVFNTGKILPGSTGNVEFTAQNTFTYTSYWPASNREKATGIINVN